MVRRKPLVPILLLIQTCSVSSWILLPPRAATRGTLRYPKSPFSQFLHSAVSSSAKRLPDEPADNGQKGSWMDEQDILTRLSKWNDPVTEKSAQSMESLLRQVDRKNLTRQHLIIATEAWRTVGRLDKAAGTLDWMLELGRDSPRLEPFRAVWRPIFLALLREKNVKKAKSILVKMEQLRIISQQPDLEEYKLLLRDMARRGAAADAEALVKQMVDRCKRFDSESYKLPKSYGACQSTPDRETYQLLLDAHAKSRSPRSGQRAMEILVELHALAEQSSSLITPDSQMYASVVSAIAYNFPILKHAVEMIDELLKQAARKGVDLDAQLFNTCLNGYARLASGHTAKRADLILEEMRRRDIATAESYNLVLKAWMKSGRPESYQRSLIILRQMEECKLANSVSYTRVIGVASQRGTREAAEEATECLIKLRKLCRVERSGSNRPNKQAYNHVLHAWISCGDVERAESILKEMEQIPTTADSALSSPNVVSYSIVIDGWAKSNTKDSHLRAESVFNRMVARYNKSGTEDVAPNMFSYVSLVSAYARSKSPDAATKAEDIVKLMYEKYKAGDVNLKPNVKIVTNAMGAYKNGGRYDAGVKAEALLDWLLERYAETNDNDFAPNEITFGTAIAAWGKSGHINKAIEARRVLDRMIALYKAGNVQAKPTTIHFSSVIRASADGVQNKQQSLLIACQTFNELRSGCPYGQADSLTYTHMLYALRSLLPVSKERSDVALAIFKTACKDGFVNITILRYLSAMLSAEELTEVGPVTFSWQDIPTENKDIPIEWRRRVR